VSHTELKLSTSYNAAIHTARNSWQNSSSRAANENKAEEY